MLPHVAEDMIKEITYENPLVDACDYKTDQPKKWQNMQKNLSGKLCRMHMTASATFFSHSLQSICKSYNFLWVRVLNYYVSGRCRPTPHHASSIEPPFCFRNSCESCVSPTMCGQVSATLFLTLTLHFHVQALSFVQLLDAQASTKQLTNGNSQSLPESTFCLS